MIELPLVLVGGLLGSAHCLGMCGAFALLIGAPARSWPNNLARQLVYSAGRIFTYAALGAAVGYGGLRIADGLGRWVNVPAAVAIAAGVLLVFQGLVATGMLGRGMSWLRRVLSIQSPAGSGTGPGLGCLVGGMVGAFLRDRRWSSVFLAGVLTGLLPCGLVYAFAAFAASTSDPLLGAATMVAFGAGTVPMMVLAGTGAQLLSLTSRQRMLTIAAWCVVFTGALSIARGVSFLQIGDEPQVAGCPLCD